MNAHLAEAIVDAILEEVEQWAHLEWFNDDRSFQEIRDGLVTLVQRWSPWGCSTPSKAWATAPSIAG